MDAQAASGEVVLPGGELDATLAFFNGRLGFQLEVIFPADDPRVAVIEGHGLRLRLERDSDQAPGHLRIACASPTDEQELTAPNGTRITLVAARDDVEAGPLAPALTFARDAGNAAWNQGRAGMLYRDLIPDRQGGRFLASHIRIPQGGPVPDYVHYHRVRFQMIHCVAGWVRLVYEDQGPPFVMEAGEWVLQPPGIRHRVLECSDGLEVLEIGSPAEHETRTDRGLELPNARGDVERTFGGQRFARGRLDAGSRRAWRSEGFEARESTIAAATTGMAGARLVRPQARVEAAPRAHAGELCFWHVLAGEAQLELDGRREPLGTGTSCTLPAGALHALRAPSADLELFEVTLPAVLPPF